MCKNSNFIAARKAKNDEFYTQFLDIEREINHYKDQLRGKIIYCNCDNPSWSNFYRYFRVNFTRLGLKKLVSSYYNDASNSIYSVYDGEVEIITKLKGNGDFRSSECLDILKTVDIVITNPPFSLFREYVSILMENDKKFVIIGAKGALVYKEIFPLMKENKIWLGWNHSNGTLYFHTPNNPEKASVASYWYSNLEISKRYKKLKLTKTYTPELYPKYDNYDAININKVIDIPMDYSGVMGVPITFIQHYNPEQFEIVGIANHGSDSIYDLFNPFLNKKELYPRILIKKIS